MTPEDIANRFDYHQPKDAETMSAHESIRLGCRQLAEYINRLCPEGREKACAVTKVEEAMFWANAAIARNNNG